MLELSRGSQVLVGSSDKVKVKVKVFRKERKNDKNELFLRGICQNCTDAEINQARVFQKMSVAIVS